MTIRPTVDASGEVQIACSAEQAFTLIADQRNIPRWNPRISHATLEGEPGSIGSRYALHFGDGRGAPTEVGVITESNPPHRIRFVGSTQYSETSGGYDITVNNDGTCTLRMVSRAGLSTGFLSRRLSRRRTDERIPEWLDRIKLILETGTPTIR